MSGRSSGEESWKRMVLRSSRTPYWLSEPAAHGEIVLSSRFRIARNLRGYRFPHRASRSELREIQETILSAVRTSHPHFESIKGLSEAERNYLVGCRMISPDFESDAGGRALLLDSDRSISVMVNEEDHLRVQAITPGWSIDRASQLSTQCLAEIQDNSVFAWNETFGYLTASPFNAGFGRRMSAMFHLIGLAQAKRLPSVLRALASQGLTARGLFGESSRATGAFVQISVVGASTSDFVGACDYLLHEERDARDAVDDTALADKTDRALHFAMRSKTVTLADALRVLAWVRWASVRNLSAYALPGRQVDHYLTILELRSGKDDERSARHRAEFLRSSLQNLAAV